MPNDLSRRDCPLGDYRVLYLIADTVLMVTVVRVAHRKDVYRP
ncbi:MAG: type II toxin-antitoxin system RelE family toxin [Anaerolineales bacterium]